MTAVEVRGGPALPQERRLVTEIPGPVSREWTQRRLAAVSNAVSVTMPVFAVAAGGGVVVDADGNSLIDFGSGIAVTTVGNAAPQVVAAVQEQVERFTHTCFMITPYAGYVEVAEALNALTPGDHDKRTALFNSGAEAVENAVKIARLATGRSAVAAFDHAYHGRTNLTMALTAKALPYKLGFGPFAPEVYRAPLSYPFHDGLSGEAAAARAISVLDKQVGATQLAAVVVEPIQGEGGFRSRARVGSSCPPPDSCRRSRRGAVSTGSCSSRTRCRAGSPGPARCSPASTRASSRTWSPPRRASQAGCRWPA
jgi:4-aminobutyrate aminotransferase/(S)-3-amino-2-methylpropionate transaminase